MIKPILLVLSVSLLASSAVVAAVQSDGSGARQIEGIVMDPDLETADIEVENNHGPRRTVMSRLQLYQDKLPEKNPMQEQKDH